MFRKERNWRFKPGHKAYINPRDNPSSIEEKNYKRLSHEVYSYGIKGVVVPSILKPKPPLDLDELLENDSEGITSNRIVNMEVLSDLMSRLYAEHCSKSPVCTNPSFIFPSCTEKVQGLGSSVEVLCKKCNFKFSHHRLFCTLPVNGPGKPAAEINRRLGQYIGTNEISFVSVQRLFSILDCIPPCEKTIMRHVYKSLEITAELSLKQMDDNRQALVDLAEHMPTTSTQRIIIGSDALYNNSARGALRQPGTQSVSPFIDMTTEKGLVVGMQSFSQVCPYCSVTSTENCSKCFKTYPDQGPMSNVEKYATQRFFDDIDKTRLGQHVTHFLADGSNSILSGVKDKGIVRVLCTQHLKRGQKRLFYRVAKNLRKGLFGSSDPNGRKLELALLISNRCAAEITLARRIHENDSEFFEKCKLIRINILFCISGDHTLCKDSSMLCRPQLNDGVLKDKWKFTAKDRRILQEVVDYRLVNVV